MKKPLSLVKNQSNEKTAPMPEEINALHEQTERNLEESANVTRMNAMLLKVRAAFKIDETFSVIAFKDKGKSIEIGVENNDYICTFVMKDTERHGLIEKCEVQGEAKSKI